MYVQMHAHICMQAHTHTHMHIHLHAHPPMYIPCKFEVLVDEIMYTHVHSQ